MSIAAIYLGWAVATWVIFRRCRPAVAVLGSFLGGWILLPVGNYSRGLGRRRLSLLDHRPRVAVGHAACTKAWVASGSALLGVVAFDRDALRRLRPTWLDAPIVLWCAVAGAARRWSPTRRGLRPRSPSAYLAGCWGVPWLLGRLYFSSLDGQRLLVKGLVISALACLPFSLIEGTFGPRVYDWVYGPHPFRFDGDVRYVGFRPLGFFENGNQFGLWVSLCALAALWLARASLPGPRRLWIGAALLLVAMAIAAQSIGALLLLVLGAAALWASGHVRARSMIVAATALLVLAGAVYVSGALPIDRIARETSVGREVVAGFRALGRGSFTWRISQDQKLLPVAMKSPVVGTARWDWWRANGTRPWGLSLLVVGQYGLGGLSLMLATLLGPALAATWRAPVASVWRPDGVPLLLAALAMLSVVDALLNSFFFFPAIVAAGALAGSGRAQHELTLAVKARAARPFAARARPSPPRARFRRRRPARCAPASSRAASSLLWLRTDDRRSAGSSVRATSAILRTSIVSGVATTSIRAVAMCAWTRTVGSVALPNTAAIPRARSCSTASRFSSTTTKAMPAASSASAMRLPTRP